ncbi:MAG TPA: hypothetical protein ENK51_04535 [Gammaproteobacteria bacterium]|nr:hypothetical protein [Gammaproteobacteria bacterium]
MQISFRRVPWGILVLASLLSACGGGSGKSSGNPPGGLPQLSVDSPTVTEGDGGTVDLVFTATLSTPAGSDVTVDFATANATAMSGDDYIARNGTLQILAGRNQGTITIAVNGDTDVENDETLSLDLSNAILSCQLLMSALAEDSISLT